MQSIDHTLFESSAQRELDKALLVKFFYKDRPDNAASIEAGRPMFKEVMYIDIKVAGSRTGGACRPAREGDIARFPAHHEAFMKRTEVPSHGTPLTEWALMSRSMVEELAFMHVKTVEQLSEMSDTHAAKMVGLLSLKAKAAKWLDSAGDTARLNQLEALETANLEKDDRIGKLEKMVSELMIKLDAPETPVVPEVEPEVEPEVSAARTSRRNRAKATK
jgi:hypothetical protein